MLPKVISGTSAGAVLSAFLAVRTDEEVKACFHDHKGAPRKDALMGALNGEKAATKKTTTTTMGDKKKGGKTPKTPKQKNKNEHTVDEEDDKGGNGDGGSTESSRAVNSRAESSSSSSNGSGSSGGGGGGGDEDGEDPYFGLFDWWLQFGPRGPFHGSWAWKLRQVYLNGRMYNVRDFMDHLSWFVGGTVDSHSLTHSFTHSFIHPNRS